MNITHLASIGNTLIHSLFSTFRMFKHVFIESVAVLVIY